MLDSPVGLHDSPYGEDCDSQLCVTALCMQQVPCSDVEREFWRLVSSIEDDVSLARVHVQHDVCMYSGPLLENPVRYK